MAADSLIVVATLTAHPDKADQLKVVLLGLIGPTLAETGCLRYQLHQSRSNECEFVFVEEWTDDAALDEHLKAAHLQAAMLQAQPLLAQAPDIRRYSSIR